MCSNLKKSPNLLKRAVKLRKILEFSKNIFYSNSALNGFREIYGVNGVLNLLFYKNKSVWLYIAEMLFAFGHRYRYYNHPSHSVGPDL